MNYNPYVYFLTDWKAGSYPDWDHPVSKDEVLRAVKYDQRTSLYSVFKDDLADFEEWVAMTYALENEPQGYDESNSDYLDRIDVQIMTRPSI